ncbi:aldehyde dehydrogenase family protein [Streptomyces sp. NPDC047043]|uniref:aldehyde dehydrogenase family protein n=1 Tax=Streptomyces sp. NPDC047043 TaxID=3154497 RepID=UPI0033CAB991
MTRPPSPRATCPPGACACMPYDGTGIAAAIVAAPDVRMVSFTGGFRTGEAISRAAEAASWAEAAQRTSVRRRRVGHTYSSSSDRERQLLVASRRRRPATRFASSC